MRHEAWNRFFMNENSKGWYSQKDLEIVRDRKRFPYDLTSAEGKRKFEDHIIKLNEQCPGVVAPIGQKFDFVAYYA